MVQLDGTLSEEPVAGDVDVSLCRSRVLAHDSAPIERLEVRKEGDDGRDRSSVEFGLISLAARKAGLRRDELRFPLVDAGDLGIGQDDKER